MIKTPVMYGTQTFVADVKITTNDDTIGFFIVPNMKFSRQVSTEELKYDRYDETFDPTCSDDEVDICFENEFYFENEKDEEYFDHFPEGFFKLELTNERLHSVEWGDVDFKCEVAC